MDDKVIIPWSDGNGNIIIVITHEEEGYDGNLNISSDTSIGDFEIRAQTITLKTTDGSNITTELQITQIGKYVQVYSEDTSVGNEVYEDFDSLVYAEAVGDEYTNYGPLLRSAVTLDEEGNEIVLLRIDENGNLRSNC